MTKYMRKYTLQEKIKKHLIIFAVILTVMNITIHFFNSNIYERKSWKLCGQMVNLNLNLLNSQIAEIQNRQEMIAKNDVVREAVSYYKNCAEKDYNARLQYQRALDDIVYLFAQGSQVSAVYIVDGKGNYIYSCKKSPKIGYNMLDEAWYRQITGNVNMDVSYTSGIHRMDYLVNETEEQCISILRPIQSEGHYTFSADAFLVYDINLDSVLNNSGGDDTVRFAIMDEDDTVYSGEASTFTKEEEEQILHASREQKNQEQGGYVEVLRKGLFKNSMAVSAKSQMYGWDVIGIRDMSEITEMTVRMFQIFVITIAVVLILAVFLSRRIADSVLQPMHCLIEECNLVAQGNYQVQFEESQSEEISFLADIIQGMIHNVISLSGKVAEEERKVAEEGLRMLQHQINPHFLNNVLQTIKALAVTGETDKVSRAATLLGHILTYSVYKPYQNVELRTELEYLRNYIELQNIRYNGRIICTIDCEERAQKVQIPKLTLQPLAENAVNHGMREYGKLMLYISTDIEPDMICVIMSDNGKGISEEKLAELTKSLETGKTYVQGCSIGIVNVNERLKRTFGDRYGIRIHSKHNTGTTMIIQIPDKPVEEEVL